MNQMTGTIFDWLIPVAMVLFGFFFGVLVERIISNKLKRIIQRTKLNSYDIVNISLNKIPTVLAGILGIYGALAYMPIRHEIFVIVNKVLVVLIILIATISISRLSVGFIRFYAHKNQFPSVSLFTNIAKITVLVLGFLIILQYLGISITPILTALGVGGLAVALALQDTLSNLFAGMHIIASRLVSQGDYVKLETGEEGIVKDINWRNTTIQSLSNNMIIIPNVKISTSIITNYDKPEKELTVALPLSVDFTVDFKTVEKLVVQIARDVLKEIPVGVANADPSISLNSINDGNINFNVFIKVKEFTAQFAIRNEFYRRVHQAFLENQIPSPMTKRGVVLRDNSRKEGVDESNV